MDPIALRWTLKPPRDCIAGGDREHVQHDLELLDVAGNPFSRERFSSGDSHAGLFCLGADEFRH